VQKAALVETHSQQQWQWQPIKNPRAKNLPSIPHQKTLIQKPSHLPLASLLYPVVKKEVEQQFLGRGVTL
jgi:hypothetical protein